MKKAKRKKKGYHLKAEKIVTQKYFDGQIQGVVAECVITEVFAHGEPVHNLEQ